ncbi:hypothetical protein X975_22488, partial [Stegodyphus mimosarum]
MLWMLLFFAVVTESGTVPRKDKTELIPTSRQQTPINAALTGLFSPPFVVFVGMTALFHTFEKFVKDMVKSATGSGSRRRRKKKP